MNVEKTGFSEMYELISTKKGPAGEKGKILAKKRIMLGSSETCDVMIDHPDVNAIHAVIEISNGNFKIYDMNSQNGSFINGKKIVTGEFNLNDKLTFGGHEFIFKRYDKKDLPPKLEMLDPDWKPKVARPTAKLPERPTAKVIEDFIPRVDYPLTKDPKAEFSEYIFEDVEVLYPIFKYQVDKTSVEVIILFRDRIFSVDYLPSVDGNYYLVGKTRPENNEIEYAYLGKEEIGRAHV